MHTLLPYDSSRRSLWDEAVIRARNGHFMFLRGYMEYHAGRFADCSYLLLRGKRLVALLPAHRQAGDLISHNGLTFGGWILSPKYLHSDLEAGFRLLGEEMGRQGLVRLVYSPSPYPYHLGACDDDLFILQKIGARCQSTQLGAFLPGSCGLPGGHPIRRRLRAGETRLSCRFEETEDLDRFWTCLTAFLEKRHHARPVHSIEEMRLLKSRFPECIRLIIGRCGSDWLTGRIIYLSRQVLRFQYVFNMSENPRAFLHERMTDWILRQPDYARPWIDIGTSTDPASGELVESLHLHKEILGARGIPLSTWIWEP